MSVMNVRTYRSIPRASEKCVIASTVNTYEIYEEIECNEKYPLNPEISLSRNAFSQLEPHKLARPDLQHNLFSQGISVRSHKYK